MQNQPPTTQSEENAEVARINLELKQKPRIKLDFLNSFGMTVNYEKTHFIQNCVTFIEDPDSTGLNFMYPMGRQIGMRNTSSNSMKFMKFIRQSDNLR
jgi:hypothetical protein